MAISAGDYMTVSNIVGNGGEFSGRLGPGQTVYFYVISGGGSFSSYGTNLPRLYKYTNGMWVDVPLNTVYPKPSYTLSAGYYLMVQASGIYGYNFKRSSTATRVQGHQLRGIKSDFSGYESGWIITADLVNAGRICTY